LRSRGHRSRRTSHGPSTPANDRSFAGSSPFHASVPNRRLGTRVYDAGEAMERLGASEAIEEKAAREPIARAIGNLAGVVEWANDAFASLSGIPLGETVDKPVGRLLERAGIGLDVVELVAQQFFEGQVCRIAFPFERPDGRRIEVVLDVTALRDEQGEIERFLAEARERDRDEPGLASERRL